MATERIEESRGSALRAGVFLILGMLILLSFGLRLYRLEAKSLWQDGGVEIPG